MNLKTRNAHGEMVPLSALVSIEPTFGPEIVQHYNGYRSADINGGPAGGVSSGQAQAAISKHLDETLPRGFAYEWTDLSYQQHISGNTTTVVFCLCVLLVFLVLAAQYESVTLPLAIILVVPMCLLAAATGLLITHGDSNIFTQVGLVFLVGLGFLAGDSGQLGRASTYAWSVAPTVSWAALDFGSVHARLRAAKANADGALAGYQKAELARAETDVNTGAVAVFKSLGGTPVNSIQLARR